MNKQDISTAKDPDLRASLHALRRAAELARRTAIQTGTSLVVMQNGRLMRISAQELSARATTKDAPAT
ncbi:hypothetical protein RM530_11340 [Algiphilus sp. W345]|uniref:Uncharacterized protein n=1 Tax=Banduia mediterranea TaxID=3075609 RepID=A0ABU2WJB8_9GAMM|nr:hypothetical protein [Algiphilus sp. W345]MDT0497951.1 hypothetical protein [Algiphilus sp. W345]